MTNKKNQKRKLMRTYSTDSCKLENLNESKVDVDERVVEEQLLFSVQADRLKK